MDCENILLLIVAVTWYWTIVKYILFESIHDLLVDLFLAASFSAFGYLIIAANRAICEEKEDEMKIKEKKKVDKACQTDQENVLQKLMQKQLEKNENVELHHFPEKIKLSSKLKGNEFHQIQFKSTSNETLCKIWQEKSTNLEMETVTAVDDKKTPEKDAGDLILMSFKPSYRTCNFSYAVKIKTESPIFYLESAAEDEGGLPSEQSGNCDKQSSDGELETLPKISDVNTVDENAVEICAEVSSNSCIDDIRLKFEDRIKSRNEEKKPTSWKKKFNIFRSLIPKKCKKGRKGRKREMKTCDEIIPEPDELSSEKFENSCMPTDAMVKDASNSNCNRKTETEFDFEVSSEKSPNYGKLSSSDVMGPDDTKFYQNSSEEYAGHIFCKKFRIPSEMSYLEEMGDDISTSDEPSDSVYTLENPSQTFASPYKLSSSCKMEKEASNSDGKTNENYFGESYPEQSCTSSKIERYMKEVDEIKSPKKGRKSFLRKKFKQLKTFFKR